MIVHITQDLMMSSNASSAARDKGVKFRFIKTIDRALELIDENEVSHLLIDLQTPGLDTGELKEKLDTLDPSKRPRMLAYAQHVETELLGKAADAGLDAVMTRGQFHHNLKELINS
ncbi:MAG: hypothetical protein AAF456_17455 [Planctomycetota bacterium]